MTPDATSTARHGAERLAAVVVALVLLLASGITFRAWSNSLSSVHGTVPLLRGTLEKMVENIGPWHGSRVLLSERIVEATDTDDYLNRVYVNVQTGEEVTLYIAYGTNFRDLMPHRPEVCYPGNGWILEGSEVVNIATDAQQSVPFQLLHFRQGGFGTGYVTVLYYYDVDGQYCPDISLLRSKSWDRTQRMRYMAQIQIVSVGTIVTRSQSDKAVLKFAKDAVATVRDELAGLVAATEEATR